RRGEIITLQGQDIDLETGIIHANGKSGRRIVFISDDIREELRMIMPKCPHDFLFTLDNGKPILPNRLSRVFTEIVTALGFNDGITDESQKVVFHTLRHTFCSYLAMKDVSLMKIGALVGHKSTQMTQRYAKLSTHSQRSVLKYIGETLHT
ncbi:MAG: site-specific integrase, partial [Bilophila sp.]